MGLLKLLPYLLYKDQAYLISLVHVHCQEEDDEDPVEIEVNEEQPLI